MSPAPYANRVYRGDCARVLRRLPDASVDLVVTDPPYLIRYESRDGKRVLNDDNDRWLFPAFAEVGCVLKPGRFCVSFYGWSQADRFLAAWRAAGLYPVGHFVWLLLDSEKCVNLDFRRRGRGPVRDARTRYRRDLAEKA